jgi:hypothetical protein
VARGSQEAEAAVVALQDRGVAEALAAAAAASVDRTPHPQPSLVPGAGTGVSGSRGVCSACCC